jgi:WD40 repeat protein
MAGQVSGRTFISYSRKDGAAFATLCALPDSRLASGSDDNTIRLWDMPPASRPPAWRPMRRSIA